MLGKLIGFEIKLHTRQIGFWVTVVIMFLAGLGFISLGDSFSANTGERVKANGALAIASLTSIVGLGAIFFGAIFVVTGVMRDQTHKALEMIHPTPVSTFAMTLSRMIGVYVATFACLFAPIMGVFVGQFAPWIDKETLGPINILYYVQPTLIFLAVNTLIVSGLFTAIAAVTRNRALVYVSAVGLFVFYIMSSLIVGPDAPDWLISIVDPFGGNALGVTAEFWPASEQNTRMTPLSGYVGINRLVWGGFGLFLLIAVFRLFKRGLHSRKTKLSVEEDIVTGGRIVLNSAPTELSGRNFFLSMWTRFKFEYLTTVKSIPFIVLTLIALSLFGISIFVQTMPILNPDPVLPTNLQMVTTALGSVTLPLLIILVFYSGEIVWRDKVAGINEILDATPIQNGPLMAGKWLALIAIVVTIALIGIFVGMIAQMFLGDVPINVGTYFKYAFTSVVARLVLFVTLVLFIQNFMPNRIVGMIASAAAVIFFFFVMRNLPFYHPMMEFSRLSTGGMSEINGFGNFTRYKWFLTYWGSLAALFAVLSIWMWRRGLQSSLLVRLRGVGARLSRLTVGAATVFLAGFVGSGAYMYKAYNIDNEYRNRKANEKRQVRGEKLLGDQLRVVLPKIRSVEADISIQPSKQTATFKGQYVIENTTGEPLAQLYVRPASADEEDNRLLEIDGASRVTDAEYLEEIEDFGYRIYKFEPPLQAGAKTKMRFETYFHAPRLADGSPIRKNGTFVNNTQVMPMLGVQDQRMRNPDKRRKYELPKLEKRPDRTDMEARQINFISSASDYVDFKAKICTEAGQIPIAPGKLVREYEADGQTCRDYKLSNPTFNYVAFMSADYEVQADLWTGPTGENVDLEIYYHTSHDFNIDVMMEATKHSLDTYTEVFSPYQYNQIRIMEFPYASFAQGFAGTIPFSENIGFVRDPGDPTDNNSVDLASYVTMHEVGHQWFGHQIMPANTKGFNVLSEGLTENAALTAYERKFGWQRARRLMEQRPMQSYLQLRAIDKSDEPPLALAGEQSYLVYHKANWVFWGLKHYIGYDVMQGAIRGFIDEYGLKGPPYPTTKELIEALRAVAPEEYQGLITDYWERITFWDLKFDEDIDIKPNTSGGYTVSLTAIVDKKIASEETGKEISVTEIDGEELDEWVEIGFYENDPKETLGGDWMKLERVRITEPETALSFDLEERPAFIMIDPKRLLIERNVKDNAKPLKKGDLAANE